MIRFESDYLEGALPEVMQALCDTNYAQTPGYGEDEYCREAADMIRAKCSAPDADVHFLVGGTQANMIVITAALRPSRVPKTRRPLCPGAVEALKWGMSR